MNKENNPLWLQIYEKVEKEAQKRINAQKGKLVKNEYESQNIKAIPK